MKKSIHGQEISPLTLINRIHVLEGIIFELKETLKFYAEKDNHKETKIIGYNLTSNILCDDGNLANNILKKHNKSWTDLYKEVDKNV